MYSENQTHHFIPIETIEEKKAFLGPLEILEIEAPDLIAAHYQLGEIVGFQTRKILDKKLQETTPEKFFSQIKFIRNCRQQMEQKLQDPLIGKSLEEYFVCLKSWAQGADIACDFKNNKLLNKPVEGKPVTPEDLALWLQNDNLGCQTGMLRDKDGSVLVWHTEEEIDRSRIDKPRVINFQISNGEKMSFFCYPDLLPGASFAWRKGFFQAVDFLYLKGTEKPGSLANVAAWLTLRLSQEQEPRKVISSLLPFVDGYAINIVKATNGRVFGEKIEFVGETVLEPKILSPEKGSTCFQVNIFSDQKSNITKKYQEIPEDQKVQMEKRIKTTSRALKLIKAITQRDVSLEHLWRLLSFRLGAEYSYAESGVIAHLVARISKDGKIEVRVASGPSIKGETFKTLDF